MIMKHILILSAVVLVVMDFMEMSTQEHFSVILTGLCAQVSDGGTEEAD